MNKWSNILWVLVVLVAADLPVLAQSRSYRGSYQPRSSRDGFEPRDSRDSNPPRGGANDEYDKQYGVLTERNMFLKDRRRASFNRFPTTTRPAVARPLEDYFVLRGVVFEDGEYRAYIENTQGSSMLKLQAGDPVARGMILQIQMDAIEYQGPDHRGWVDLGQTLAGGVGPSVPLGGAGSPLVSGGPSTTRPSATGSTAEAVPTPPLPSGDNANLSIEERMRLRRAQELKR